LAGYSDGIAAMITELRNLNFKGKILTTSAFATPSAIAKVGDAAKGVFLTQTVFDTDSDHAHIKKFVEAYRAKYNEVPDIYAAQAYDAMMVLITAVEGRPVLPGEVKKGLRDAIKDFPGVTGSIQFDEKGDVRKFPRLYVISSDGVLADYNERVRAKQDEIREKREALKGLGDRVKGLEAEARDVEARLGALMLSLPNLPHESTPEGLDESGNVVLRTEGEKPVLGFEAKDHVALAEGLGMLDLERARKISGARFVVLRGMGARLERALAQLMLDVHVDEHGYEEVSVPSLVKDAALLGTSQLPKFEDDLFKVARHEALEAVQDGDERRPDIYLIPTGEVPVTNLHADE
ncbi:MAG: ABC transporter substrate-binding protein, partial [Planctomycetota bacterium]